MTKLIAFDTETTGIGKADQVVSASIVTRQGNDIGVTEWILQTTVPSSPEALSKHGITAEKQEAEGEPYVSTIEEIADALLEADYVVTANGTFDLTMLQRSLDAFSEKDYDLSSVKMIDIMVIDKYIDKYRKGSRRLEDLQKHYKVEVDGALHDATTDAILTYNLLFKMWPAISQAGITLEELPSLCEVQYNKQRKSLADYFKKVGKKATVTLGYPVTTSEIVVG